MNVLKLFLILVPVALIVTWAIVHDSSQPRPPLLEQESPHSAMGGISVESGQEELRVEGRRSKPERAAASTDALKEPIESASELASLSDENSDALLVRTYLNSAHEHFISSAESSLASAGTELQLASLCVAAIMRSQGRADKGRPGEIEAKGGLSLKVGPDQWCFVNGDARFAFDKGEFPEYDFAKRRETLQNTGELVAPLTEAEQLQYEGFYERALLTTY